MAWPGLAWLDMMLALAVALGGVGGCQRYPFETREPRQTNAIELVDVIDAVTPADIVFLVDNSASMGNEILQLQTNFDLFVTELAKSQNDYRVAFITPDMECNVPEQDCTKPTPTASKACCKLTPQGQPAWPTCAESDTNADGALDESNCDGGRFRSHDGKTRFFLRPEKGKETDWVDDVNLAITNLGLNGSGYEGGLEALRRALVCSLSQAERTARGLRRLVDAHDPTTTADDEYVDDCPDLRVAELNTGFLRPDADLVLIFLTDEDDCSFYNSNSEYTRITNATDAAQKAAHLCSPQECYAYWGKDLHNLGGQAMDWAVQPDTSKARFTCDGLQRNVNPPLPTDVAKFLDDIVKVKGNIAKVRAGAILGGVPDTSSAGGELGFRSTACFNSTSPGGPSAACSCLSDSANNQVYCEAISLNGGLSAPPPECEAMMGGRYVDFLNQLATRRVAAGFDGGALVDSICQTSFSSTIQKIVRTIFTNNCYNIGVATIDPEKLEIKFNGGVLNYVSATSGSKGWTLGQNPGEICLRNLGDLRVGDRLEVFVVTDT